MQYGLVGHVIQQIHFDRMETLLSAEKSSYGIKSGPIVQVDQPIPVILIDLDIILIHDDILSLKTEKGLIKASLIAI